MKGDLDFFICGVSAISAIFDGGMAAFFFTAKVGRGEKGKRERERERGEGGRKSKVGGENWRENYPHLILAPFFVPFQISKMHGPGQFFFLTLINVVISTLILFYTTKEINSINLSNLGIFFNT